MENNSIHSVLHRTHRGGLAVDLCGFGVDNTYASANLDGSKKCVCHAVGLGCMGGYMLFCADVCGIPDKTAVLIHKEHGCRQHR